MYSTMVAARPGPGRSILYREIQARDSVSESLEYDLEQILRILRWSAICSGNAADGCPGRMWGKRAPSWESGRPALRTVKVMTVERSISVKFHRLGVLLLGYSRQWWCTLRKQDRTSSTERLRWAWPVGGPSLTRQSFSLGRAQRGQILSLLENCGMNGRDLYWFVIRDLAASLN